MPSQSACSLGYGWESGRPHGWPVCTSSGQKLRPSLVVFLAAWLADWELRYSLVASLTAKNLCGDDRRRELVDAKLEALRHTVGRDASCDASAAVRTTWQEHTYIRLN